MIGLPLVLALPLGFIPLLGYAVAVVRASAADPSSGPPPWRPLGRLLADGLLMATVLSALTMPFILLVPILARPARLALGGLGLDSLQAGPVAAVIASAVAALPWGILLLVLMPATTARFACSGSSAALIDAPAALRLIRRRFGAWNLVVVAIVTSWAIGLAALGLAFIGVVPGVLYAILVSAHATATLADA